jgi:hypothetical protein
LAQHRGFAAIQSLLLSNRKQARRKIPRLLAGSTQFLLRALHFGQIRSDQANTPRAVQPEWIQGQADGQSVSFLRLQTDLAPAGPLGRAPEQSVQCGASPTNQALHRRTNYALKSGSQQPGKTAVAVQDSVVAAKNGGAFVHPLHENTVGMVGPLQREHLLPAWAVHTRPSPANGGGFPASQAGHSWRDRTGAYESSFLPA